MISKEDIEKVRAAVDMVKYLSFRGVEAHQAGTSWKALCPLHNERSPSFNIRPELQIFHCFGCGESGDIFALVQALDALSFKGAIQELAEYAEITLTEEEDENFKKTKRLYALTKTASEWFRENFVNIPDEHPAKSDFAGRNLLKLANEDETIGFAPNNGMVEYLRSKGFTINEMREAGLLSSNEEKVNALFRKRTVWSIKNIQGYIVGFTARKIYENDLGGKYINSPQTKLYNKSLTLFGLYEAHKAITKYQSVYIVEGQTDVMALRAIGIENVVAANGTAFGKEHVHILQRLADRGKESKQFVINFCFDADTAGIKAARRMFELETSLHTTANIITLPEGDPCDVRMKYGDEELRRMLLEDKTSLLEFILKKELEEWDVRTPEGQAKFIEQANKILISIDNPIVLDSYKRKISWWTGVPLSNMAFSSKNQRVNKNQNAETISSSELRKRVIAIILQYPNTAYNISHNMGIKAEMFQKEGRIIYDEAVAIITANQNEGKQSVLRADDFSNPQLVSQLLFLDVNSGVNNERITNVIINICKVFLADYRNQENNLIQARIHAATEDNNIVEDEELLKEILEARENSPVRRRKTVTRRS